MSGFDTQIHADGNYTGESFHFDGRKLFCINVKAFDQRVDMIWISEGQFVGIDLLNVFKTS